MSKKHQQVTGLSASAAVPGQSLYRCIGYIEDVTPRKNITLTVNCGDDRTDIMQQLGDTGTNGI